MKGFNELDMYLKEESKKIVTPNDTNIILEKISLTIGELLTSINNLSTLTNNNQVVEEVKEEIEEKIEEIKEEEL